MLSAATVLARTAADRRSWRCWAALRERSWWAGIPQGRAQVGCWSHARRKFFKALPVAPEAQQAMDFIREL
ncbi:transposase [Archangium minus]|uniref:Transposase n=1 Tax=Archangium minus TaxID=83450 RepID=A0ABY9XB86_9BACT|nr:transposase [Archangium minus]